MDRERYDRQIRMPELGLAGQARLSRSRVLVVGAGGLGSPVLLYLAAAGVGAVAIADGDVVTRSNLNRQILHRTADLGVAKVDSAARAIAALNPEVAVTTIGERLDAERIAMLASDYDLLIDAADGFPSKLALNDAAVQAGVPLVHAGVERLVGQVAVVAPPDGPCLRCIFPDPPPEPPEPRAILGAAAGVVGSLQALVAIEILAAMDGAITDRLLVVDLGRLDVHAVQVDRNPQCAVCGVR